MDDFTRIGFDNIQRIQFDKFENDFSFIVYGKIYNTNLVVENILSPNISNMLSRNVIVSYYEINTEYEGEL